MVDLVITRRWYTGRGRGRGRGHGSESTDRDGRQADVKLPGA